MVENTSDRDTRVSNASRRTVLKATSGALAGVGLSGLVSASDDDTDDRVEGEVPYPDHSKLLVDDSVRSLTPQYDLLTLSKDRLRELVSEGGLREKREREVLDALKDLWKNYPVKKVRDGNDFVFTLAEDQAKGRVTDDDAEQFSKASRAVARGFAKENGGRDEIGTQWYGSTHEDMTQFTLENHFDLYDFREEDIIEASTAPDTDPCDCSPPVFDWSDMPDWVADGIKKGLDEFAHHYGHYYDPDAYTVDLCCGITIEFGGLGGAPRFCEYEMDQAKNTSYSTKREHLGRALHYVQDVSVPLHSGMALEQMNFELDCDWDGCEVIDPYYDLHYSYEEWVRDNFDSGENFVDDYDRMLAWNSDPFDCVYQVADSGSSYSYEVFHLIKENGTDFDTWGSTDYNDLVEATSNPMAHAGGYTHALIDQIYD